MENNNNTNDLLELVRAGAWSNGGKKWNWITKIQPQNGAYRSIGYLGKVLNKAIQLPVPDLSMVVEL